MTRFSFHRVPLFLALAAVLLLAASAFADEGMWTLDNPPLKQLKEKYGFEPTPRPGWSISAWPRCGSATAARAPSSAPTAWC